MEKRDCPFNFIEIKGKHIFSGIAILDHDGKRILAKYYDKAKFPTLKDETKFEKLLFRKTVKASNEIIMLEGLTILYRSSVDIFCYVMGSSYENELILLSALDCLFTSLNSLLRKDFEKKALLGWGGLRPYRLEYILCYFRQDGHGAAGPGRDL